MLKDNLPLGIRTALFGLPCSGNFFCAGIKSSAAKLIAKETGLSEEAIIGYADPHRPGVSPSEIIDKQDSSPRHPQTVYRRFRSKDIIIVGGRGIEENMGTHAISSKDYNQAQKNFSKS